MLRDEFQCFTPPPSPQPPLLPAVLFRPRRCFVLLNVFVAGLNTDWTLHALPQGRMALCTSFLAGEQARAAVKRAAVPLEKRKKHREHSFYRTSSLPI